MIKIGIAGYGNLGRGVEAAVTNSDDMELVGVFTRRDPASVQIKTPGVPVLHWDDAADWKEFVFNNWDWDKIADMEHDGVLYFYRKAFDKVCREVKSTKVSEGTIVLWNLYNMGYVVKTPTQTFGIDLFHKHIGEISYKRKKAHHIGRKTKVDCGERNCRSFFNS